MQLNPAVSEYAATAEGRPVSEDISWRQLLSLALLYASVIIGWIAYYNYQPKLLTTYQFTDLTLFLYIVQGVIMVITPLIAGRLGDKYRMSLGQRLPIISAGVSFAAMIFMATAFTLFTEPGPVFRWILPGLITLWLFSMSLFTSPAISTVELFVPADRLPTAMAILTMVYGLLYSIEPVIVQLIDLLGAPLTFVVGGVAVFFSGMLMKKNTKLVVDKPKKTELRKSDYTYALVLGIAYGMVTTVMFNLLPEWFEAKQFEPFGISGSMIISVILAMVAVLSLPMGKFSEGRPVYFTVLISILASVGIIVSLYFATGFVVLIALSVVFAMAYAMMSVSFLPLALTIIRDEHKVLGVGVFFAGFELPNSILEAWLVAIGQL